MDQGKMTKTIFRGIKALVEGQAELKAGQARIEAKLDAFLIPENVELGKAKAPPKKAPKKATK